MSGAPDEGSEVLRVVRDYARAWRLLGEFDDDRLPERPSRATEPADSFGVEEAHAAIAALRDDLRRQGRGGKHFGEERGHPLGAILRSLEQTFDGQALYPSVQIRAANLLYLVIKDHPFVDGNKRIGALLFLDYLRRNGLLMRADRTLRLSDTTLVTLALLVAESEAVQKDLMVRLIMSLLEDTA